MKHDIRNLVEKCQNIKRFCKCYDVECVAVTALTCILALSVVSFILIIKA